jgi:hypothetical protein
MAYKMSINKFGILAINQKSPKDITEGILYHCLTLRRYFFNRLKYGRHHARWGLAKEY